MLGPSNQQALAFDDDPGALLMAEARAWVADNPDAWESWMGMARSDKARGRCSAKFYTEATKPPRTLLEYSTGKQVCQVCRPTKPPKTSLGR